jgi:WS/DGAT/MGAT family acyltransferase
MGKRERMSSVDTAWLRMDSPGNLMMIVGVYEYDRPLDFARLREIVQSRFVVHRRFRSRVVQDATGYYWEEDDDFDLDLHLVRTALPGKGTTEDLKRFAGRMASTALDPSRALWQFQLVDNYQGGQAMVVRIHHCIADGIALIGVLLAMTSQDPVEDPVAPAPAPAQQRGPTSDWEALLRPLTDVTVKAIDTTGDVAGRVLAASSAMLNDREAVGEAAGEYARIAAQVAKDAAAIALMDNDTVTSLKGQPSGSKAVAWNEPLALDDVKAVGKALGCSVNDVLLASVAGAIRGYLVDRGEDVAGCELRAMVPVNLRDPKSWKELGNKFGLVPLLLPVGIENPIARVFEVQRRMTELKASYQAVLAMAILGLVGLAPRMLQKQALDFLAKKGTAVMTNVPGPQQPLYMAGAMIRRMMFWVPQSGDIGVGVSILSYAGGVQFGLITDKKLCPEPQRIIERFAPEFEKLVLALCMLPWDRPVDADAAQDWLFTPMPGPAATAGRPPTKRRRRASPQARKAMPAADAADDSEATPPATDESTPAGVPPPQAEPSQAAPAAAPDGNGAGSAEPAAAERAAAAPARPPGVRARRSAFAAARAAE